MTAPVTHSSHSSIGHALQAKLAQHKPPRHKPRAKPKTYRRSQPAGQRQHPRVSQLERGLKRTVNGRQVLRLGDQLPEARAGVLLAEEGLRLSEAHLQALEQQLLSATRRQRTGSAATVQRALRQAEHLELQLVDAEAEARRWRAELATWTAKCDRLQAEIPLTATWL